MRPTQPVAALALGLALLTAGGTGCGGVKPGRPALVVAKVTRSSGERRAGKPTAAQSVVARIDVSSDRIIAEGKVHIAAGAPSDAQVRRELEAARKAGAILPSGESARSFEEAEAHANTPLPEVQTPETPWNPRAKPIADWIVPVLQWAYEHGWRGAVTSGYRTFYEQAQLNAAGAYSATAGLSNHETAAYPGGAVDVTQPAQLIAVLRGYPGPRRLIGGVLGPIDPEHFSATGD